MDSLLASASGKTGVLLDPKEARRRQYMAGWTMEDAELVLQPMAQTGKEAIGSMGDDTRWQYFRTLSWPPPFFKPNFSQVTNPPIDSLRERVMSLQTGSNLGNILDEAPEQCDLCVTISVLTVPEWDALCLYLGDKAETIDCTFIDDGSDNAFTAALDRIQAEAEDAVRSGCEHVMLTDRNVNEDRVPLPMILATGAVHSHLVKQQLRTFASVNVASGECLDVHHFAVLIGVGATTVNAYVAESAIADRHARGLLPGLELGYAVGNYRKAIEDGLLKIMSKMGISVITSYRGGYNFEALGLSRSLVATYFPPMSSRISGLGLKGIAAGVLKMHKRHLPLTKCIYRLVVFPLS